MRIISLLYYIFTIVSRVLKIPPGMNEQDYITIHHPWGFCKKFCSRFVPGLFQRRTKGEQKRTKNKRRTRGLVEQNWNKIVQREQKVNIRSCDNFATLLLLHHCCNFVTVLQLGNSVTIVQQCCRIVTNILKVCVCVPIE